MHEGTRHIGCLFVPSNPITMLDNVPLEYLELTAVLFKTARQIAFLKSIVSLFLPLHLNTGTKMILLRR